MTTHPSKNPSGPLEESEALETCQHNALRKKRGAYTFDCYVCGSCAALFEVKPHVEQKPIKEPMFDGRPPWGLRDRQA